MCGGRPLADVFVEGHDGSKLAIMLTSTQQRAFPAAESAAKHGLPSLTHNCRVASAVLTLQGVHTSMLSYASKLWGRDVMRKASRHIKSRRRGIADETDDEEEAEITPFLQQTVVRELRKAGIIEWK